jgi:dolichol-phosphate mannosyltransferase
VSFWDRHSEDVRDAALYGTVTREASIVRLRDRLEKAHFARVVPLRGDERVLDLGGGAGRMALWLAPRVREVVLVDESAALLEVARERIAVEGVRNVSVVRASAADYREGEFDLVLVFGVLTHLDDAELERVAENIARMLPSHGRLVVKEPVTSDGVAREDRRGDYLARFRPRERYAEVLGRRMPLLYQSPSVAHPIPFFLGGTEENARRAGSATASRALDAIAPLWEKLEEPLLSLERSIRQTPGVSRLLADVPVLQDLYVFGAPLGRSPHGHTERCDLSIAVIAFNEEECLEGVVSELVRAIELAGIAFEVILVDDGSSDATLAIMRRLAARDARLRLVPLSPNRGIGGALRAGFDAARGTHVTWVPADGQIDPATVIELYRRREEAPMLTTVYAARDDAFYRTVISKTLNTIIEARTGQKAKSGGNYLFRRELWERYAPRGDDTMMISTAFRNALRDAGEAIVEVPIRARARVAGSSKVLNPRTILRTLAATVLMRRT